MEIKQIYGNIGAYSTQGMEGTSRTAQAGDADRTDQTTASEGGDEVALSSQARLLAAAMSTAGGASDVRTDKVSALKAQVAAGTYTPDAKKAAANLLRDDMEVGG